jgi:ubiquinone/menaquinone biosynthesis C-methylase UbiE
MITKKSELAYQQKRITHWDLVAQKFGAWSKAGRYYQEQLIYHYKFFVPEGLNILEVGCGRGDLLAALKPRVGVGIDFSGEMIKRAIERHPHLRFEKCDAHHLIPNEQFDIIILSDLVNDLWDVQAVFENLRGMADPRTRLILNTYSRLWQIPLSLAQRFGLSKPNLEQNWLTVEDLRNILNLCEFEVIKHTREIILPIFIPLISPLANRFLAKLWPFSHFAFTNFIIARLEGSLRWPNITDPPKVSVIIPARNEAGNIEEAFTRVPKMGSGTELVFVEGHSSDDTFEAIRRAKERHPECQSTLLKQTGKGKGDAVRLGFENATGDILMILDADLTVSPEDLSRFYQVLVTGKGEFINGIRLVYPRQGKAMRFFNVIGNKFFSLAFSWLLGQQIKDTLCGTKVLWMQDYERIARNRFYFGDFDPFGDFDLLFGAAKINLKIVDLAIRYKERTYGTTNISRWKDGWLLLKMILFAASRIKFI